LNRKRKEVGLKMPKYIQCRKGKRERRISTEVCKQCKKNHACDSYLKYLSEITGKTVHEITGKGIVFLSDEGSNKPENVSYSK